MAIINRIGDFQDEMTAWRRDLHAHPEIGFEEVRTSGIVAEKLKGWGIEVHRGLGGTGMIGGHAALHLRAQGAEVTLAARKPADASPRLEAAT